MPQLFKRNSKSVYNSLKYLRRNLLALPFLMALSIPIAYYIKGFSWVEAFQYAPLINLMAFIILGLIPTSIIHINHYKANKDMQILIDQQNEMIRFDSPKIQESFHLSHLKISQYLTFNHNKSNKFLKHLTTPWSNFSFLKITTGDGYTFYVSSTLVSFNDLPFKANERYYTFWPIIKKNSL